MVQRGVDGAEKRAARCLAGRVVQALAGVKQAGVEPGVVAREKAVVVHHGIHDQLLFS
jgi:hypothetical protein